MKVGDKLYGAQNNYSGNPRELKEYAISRMGRKFFYVIETGHNREIKVDPVRLWEVVEVGSKIQFYVSEESYQEKKWADKHGWRIAEKVKYLPADKLKEIAAIVGYEEAP